MDLSFTANKDLKLDFRLTIKILWTCLGLGRMNITYLILYNARNLIGISTQRRETWPGLKFKDVRLDISSQTSYNSKSIWFPSTTSVTDGLMDKWNSDSPAYNQRSPPVVHAP